MGTLVPRAQAPCQHASQGDIEQQAQLKARVLAGLIAPDHGPVQGGEACGLVGLEAREHASSRAKTACLDPPEATKRSSHGWRSRLRPMTARKSGAEPSGRQLRRRSRSTLSAPRTFGAKSES